MIDRGGELMKGRHRGEHSVSKQNLNRRAKISYLASAKNASSTLILVLALVSRYFKPSSFANSNPCSSVITWIKHYASVRRIIAEESEKNQPSYPSNHIYFRSESC